MDAVFGLLFYLAIIGLIWGLISPAHFARKAKIKKPLSRKRTALVFSLLAIVFVALGAATTPKTVNLNSSDAASHNQAKTSSSAESSIKPVVTTKQVTDTQSVAFTTTNEDNSALAKGQTEIKQAGQNGSETLTYKVTYTNGQQTSKTLVSTVITTKPVDQIVDTGTYVAPTPASTTTTSPAATTQSCTPLSNEGTCYEPGEYCRQSDAGITGVAGDGKTIKCEYNNGLRWEPI